MMMWQWLDDSFNLYLLKGDSPPYLTGIWRISDKELDNALGRMDGFFPTDRIVPETLQNIFLFQRKDLQCRW